MTNSPASAYRYHYLHGMGGNVVLSDDREQGAAPSAADVAALIVARQCENGVTVDQRQLQSFLYLTYMSHFVFWNRRAFREQLFASDVGPIVEKIEQMELIELPAERLEDRLGALLAATIGFVLKQFGAWDALSIEAFITSPPDSPWRQAREVVADQGTPVPMSEEMLRHWAKNNALLPSR